MIKLILVFLITTGLIATTIKVVQQLTESERWKVAKVMFVSAICAIISTSTLTLFVAIF